MFGILKKKSLQDKIIIRQDNISITLKQILKDIIKTFVIIMSISFKTMF